ncbi:hypothetical protein NQZ68_012471, partial [Dissostichus eleginoides]
VSHQHPDQLAVRESEMRKATPTGVTKVLHLLVRPNGLPTDFSVPSSISKHQIITWPSGINQESAQDKP